MCSVFLHNFQSKMKQLEGGGMLGVEFDDPLTCYHFCMLSCKHMPLLHMGIDNPRGQWPSGYVEVAQHLQFVALLRDLVYFLEHNPELIQLCCAGITRQRYRRSVMLV